MTADRTARMQTEMTRKLIFTTLAGLLVTGIANRSLAGGDEVVVIYNSQMPESEAIAYDYARKREVPKAQVFGFKLATTEEMSRSDFRDDLQRPLAKQLESRKLWRVGSGELPGTNGKPVRVTRKVVESKIRYAVLCYGVPLKILRDQELHEAAEETVRPE